MKRRKFITLLGGTAAAWPLAARAQQADRLRRIGVLSGLAKDDSDAQTQYTAFIQGLSQLGWVDGRNVHIDTRWSAGSSADARRYATELAALAPDVILASGSASAGPMLEATRTIPVVFVIVPDPVGAGLVQSLSRPGGNATGFVAFEYGLSGKWLELLKEIAPHVTRAAILRDPSTTAGVGQFAFIQSAAPVVGMDVSAINLDEATEIERAIVGFAHSPNGGLIVTATPLAVVHRDLILKLAAQCKLPAVYFESHFFVPYGGLISYGPNFPDEFRRAATYVDRILKGEKPSELPVQTPTSYELAINVKTARALGLTVPSTLLVRAAEVIE
jgi:putative tryptophan/tyrosine transport system substrate-binding protein